MKLKYKLAETIYWKYAIIDDDLSIRFLFPNLEMAKTELKRLRWGKPYKYIIEIVQLRYKEIEELKK